MVVHLIYVTALERDSTRHISNGSIESHGLAVNLHFTTATAQSFIP